MDFLPKNTIIRLVVAALISTFIGYNSGLGFFLSILIFAAIYLWLGVAWFFIDMIWRLFAKPDERLFASIMLGSTVFVTAALAGAYWLIKDSIGLTATIIYAIGAYGIFSIVRWFRRHTASYYAALEADKAEKNDDKGSQSKSIDA